MATLKEAVEALGALSGPRELYQLAVSEGYGGPLLARLRQLLSGAGDALGHRAGVESLTEQIDTLTRQRELALEGRAWVVNNAPQSPQKTAVLGAIDLVAAEWARRAAFLTAKRLELQQLVDAVS